MDGRDILLGDKDGLALYSHPISGGQSPDFWPGPMDWDKPCPEPDDISQGLVTWAEGAKAESPNKGRKCQVRLWALH